MHEKLLSALDVDRMAAGYASDKETTKGNATAVTPAIQLLFLNERQGHARQACRNRVVRHPIHAYRQ